MKIQEPSELLKNIKNKFNANDKFIMLVVFILGIINNFTFFITKGISPDALAMTDFDIASGWEISLGRYGLPFANLLRFGLINKFLIVLICLLCFAFSVMILVRIFKINNKLIIFLISAIISVAPQFTETYFFIYCADAYCIAFFMSILAVYFMQLTEKNKRYYILTGICTIIVCSLYQAYLGVLIGLTIILLVEKLIKNGNIKEAILQTIQNFLIIFTSIVLYYIMLKIIVAILGLSLASYKGANSLGINTIRSLPKTIMQTYKDFINFFFTNKVINNTYYGRIIINGILFLASFIGIVLTIKKNKSSDKILRATLIILSIIILPIGINIMDVVATGTTVNLVTGPGFLSLIILVSIIYNELADNTLENIIKYIYILTLLILVFTFILENTFTYMARQETYENYYAVINDIYTKATNLDEYSTDKKWMFSDVICYKVRYLERTNGFISKDNETWKNYSGTTMQNSNYFDKYLGLDIKTCSKEEYKQMVESDEFKNMPIYPNKGSIKIINNIIVIKISEKTFE